MCGFLTACGVGTPNPRVVLGLTVINSSYHLLCMFIAVEEP